MPPDLLTIARRHLSRARTVHEINERNAESSPTDVPPADLSSYPSFPSSAGAEDIWGCHRGEVNRLLADADGLIETLSVSGMNPEIVSAANMVMSAVLSYDIETVRFAMAEFTVVVRTVAATIRT